VPLTDEEAQKWWSTINASAEIQVDGDKEVGSKKSSPTSSFWNNDNWSDVNNDGNNDTYHDWSTFDDRRI
jgi:hypothetical protein